MANTDREPFTVVVEPSAERPPANAWMRAGYAAVGIFFAALILWGGVAPLESAAVAVGSVSLDTNKKLVQHLEGGIVAAVKVRDGQEVEKGQVLLEMDVTQYRGRIDLLKAKIQGAETQLKLVLDELETVEQLFKRGNATRPRLLALQRKKAEIEADIAENKAQLRVAEDAIERANIRAPVAGIVIELKVHTAGGVIKAGETLMAIVPKDEPLYIEAQIEPNDIDVVRPGLVAHIRLTPYSARSSQPLPGKVVNVSADRMTDTRNSASYYLARIELTKRPTEIEPTIKLYPGMPAEVIIVTGHRTMLGYLFAPLTRSFRKAFREE